MSSSPGSSPHRARHFALRAGIAGAVAAGLVTVAPVPSRAATYVDNLADLQAGFAACTPPYDVTLTTDLTDEAAELVVGCSSSIDLAGHDLTLSNVVISAGASFEVTDSTPVAGGPDPNADSGTLTAHASFATAGIRNTDATLITSGTVRVIARGDHSAGIGGDVDRTVGGDGGTTLTTDHSYVQALGGGFSAGIGGAQGFEQAGDGGITTTDDDSHVIAVGEGGAAGIGGGYTPVGRSGSSGTTTIQGGSTVSATTTAGGSAVGAGKDRSADGTFLKVLDGTLDIGYDLEVHSFSTEVVVGSGGVITRAPGADARIIGFGIIVNGGAIRLPTVDILVPVLQRHYRVSFDTQGGSAAPDPVHVFADTFDHGGRAMPPAPTMPGLEFVGWNTAADGSGTDVTPTTTLVGDNQTLDGYPITLYAQWANPSGDLSDLQTMLSSCSGTSDEPYTVALADDLVGTSTELTVGCHARIDLAGRDLSVRDVVIAAGRALEVTDSTGDGGTLTADATGITGQAGIQTTGATLVTSGTAHVVATGGADGAGIGGDVGEDGGTTTTHDSSTVSATGGANGAGIGGGSHGGGGTTTTTGSSSVTATGGEFAFGACGGCGRPAGRRVASLGPPGGGAGIGGGTSGSGGGTTRILDGSTVTATGGSTGSAVGTGGGGSGLEGTFLDVTDGTLELGGDLVVPDTAGTPEVSVGASGTIVRRSSPASAAAITGSGTVANGGAITLPTDAVEPVLVTGHHYLVGFDTDGGSAPADDVTVLADTFTHGDRGFPADPTKDGYRFLGWNTALDGSGTEITADTALPGSSADGTALPVTVYAQYLELVASLTAPEVTGDLVFDEDLTVVSPGTWAGSPSSFTYQWLRDSTPIPGATSSHYRATVDDVGHDLGLAVTATQGLDNAATITVTVGTIGLAPMGWKASGRLAITGKAAPGRTLRSSLTRAALLAGTDPDATAVRYRWTRDGKAIATRTGPALVLRAGDKGHRIALTVTLTRPGHADVVLRSDAVRVRR